MKKVTKHTRAGKDGKIIQCPHCNKREKVFHFSFVALECVRCKAMVNKCEWKLWGGN